MLVILHEAHSGVNEVGAVTPGGTTEHSIGLLVSQGFLSAIRVAGYSVALCKGPIKDTWREINKMMKDALERNESSVAISLHFNALPGNKKKVGHTGVIRSHCALSEDLANTIMVSLSKELSWSLVLPLIVAPDSKYSANAWPNNLIWPTRVGTPHCLVEAGFTSDPRFCSWIESPQGQLRYGQIVAQAVIAWACINGVGWNG